jgi:hypothetical protein
MTAPSFSRRVRNSLTRSPHRRRATIDMTGEGFIFRRRRRETAVRWADVTQIDAGTRDYFTFDGLYIVVHRGSKKLEIDELDDGFIQFEDTMFQRWPQIREQLNRLQAGKLHEPQYETLWRR